MRTCKIIDFTKQSLYTIVQYAPQDASGIYELKKKMRMNSHE